jgi:hypothetical protein
MASMTRSSFIRSANVAAVIVAGAALAACGTSRTVVTVQEATEITKGQELLDLQRARAENAIDPQEYERLRKVIMARPR